MTLPEANDKVAQKYGQKSWKEWNENRTFPINGSLHDEAAEIYAKSKWDEACETYNRELTEHYCIKKDYRIHDDRTAYFVTTAPKPEFKP